MGGSSSKQKAKANPVKPPVKDFMNDSKTRAEANQTGKDQALVAYQRQKSSVQQEDQLVRQRTME